MSEALRVLVLIGLVSANAFFVAAEYAIVTARRGALAGAAGEGSGSAAVALRLMDHPVRVISTVQVAITAVGILAGAIGEPLVRELLGEGLPNAVAFIVAFAIVTYLTVVFGELVPKAVSLDRAEAIARLIARPVDLIGRILRPLVWVLERSARIVLKAFGIDHVIAGQAVRTASDLQELVDEAEQSGVIPRAQEELLHNVFDFATLEAADAMVPGHAIVWLDADTSPDQALETVIDTAHTRFPVGEGTIDRVVGVIHAREIAAASRSGEPKTIRPLVRDAMLVPETKDLGALLREMREGREQLAIVASEYGTTRGIITIEDILEEIVGEIESEYELPDAAIKRIDEHTVRVAGSITVDDFNETLHTDLPQDGPRTLAGLVFDRLGRAPNPGDTVTIGSLELHVAEVEGVRITKLEVREDPAELEVREYPGEGGG
jgi:putative hemolysin